MVMNSYMLVYNPLGEIVAYASFIYLICFGINTEYSREMLQLKEYFFIRPHRLQPSFSFRAFG
jgi:hypothetical protein